MAFKNRWRIQGTLTTKTPLHVGDGDVTTRPELVDESMGKPVEISAVATAHSGRAYIPGTTLKGNLRAWLSQNNISSRRITTVFGSEDPGTKDAVGGKAEFRDAFAAGTPDPSPHIPYWNASRLTGVATSVAIDRKTRTASPNKLFHEEFVPPGISFEVTITGQDLEPEELDLLLFTLEGFNNLENSVSIGADTGDEQGRFTWKLTEIARLRKKDVAAWLQQQNPPGGFGGLVPLEEADREAMRTHALSVFQAPPSPSLTLSLEIRFDGPFLVNDPSRTKKSKRTTPTDDRIPDHAPLRNHQGRLVLPARSIRGAIRSQAEKIVRTLKSEAACLAVNPDDACGPIYKDSQRETHLCLTCQVFGAPGWRAPIEFSDFLPPEESTETGFHQEFLAIDRFTGGGAHGLKFDAVAVYQPTLRGTITVDLNRVHLWALGLLALTLRDLIEGDIPLGFGAAKGYGACKAAVRGIQVTSLNSASEELKAILRENDAIQVDFNRLDPISKPPDEVQCVIIELVKAFHTKATSFQRRNAERGGPSALS